MRLQFGHFHRFYPRSLDQVFVWLVSGRMHFFPHYLQPFDHLLLDDCKYDLQMQAQMSKTQSFPRDEKTTSRALIITAVGEENSAEKEKTAKR